MNLKWAMIKAFEYAMDNDKKTYHDIFVYSSDENICFSIFDKSYDFQGLKELYDDISNVSFEVFVTVKKFI